MIVPGCIYNAGRIHAEVAANPTPSYFHGGFGFASNGRLCVSTNAVDAQDHYRNGFRITPLGAIRGSVSGGVDGPVGNGGYWFTTDGRLRISDGVSAVSRFNNGDGFVASGRVALLYP